MVSLKHMRHMESELGQGRGWKEGLEWIEGKEKAKVVQLYLT